MISEALSAQILSSMRDFLALCPLIPDSSAITLSSENNTSSLCMSVLPNPKLHSVIRKYLDGVEIFSFSFALVINREVRKGNDDIIQTLSLLDNIALWTVSNKPDNLPENLKFISIAKNGFSFTDFSDIHRASFTADFLLTLAFIPN